MTSTGPTKSDDDEIDLRELALSVWSGRTLIFAASMTGLVLSGAYGISRPPQYKAEAIFEMMSSSQPQVPSEFAGLASMAGLPVGGKEDKGIFDRVLGRDFILAVSADLNLPEDEFFNPQAGPVGIFSITGAKLALGLVDPADLVTDAEDQVTRTYLRAVTVAATKNGSIRVSVQHRDAKRASEIANGIVTRVLQDLAEEQKRDQRSRLSYLSDQLAEALANVEETKKAVADFALANSLTSPEAFATRSQAMFELGEELRRAREMAAAVADLTSVMTSTATPDATDYASLKARAPIIDDVDFRRLIGVPEALDAWAWPPRERLGDFSSTLRDRTARIERSIDELRGEAERYATATEELASLEREAKVAEATYNVLIEQVKAQALVTGYQGEIARVYQSATPPTTSSGPKLSLILALGAVLGAILGAGFGLIRSLRSGHIHSNQAMQEISGASLLIAATGLDKRANGTFAQVSARIDGIASPSLTELAIMQRTASARVTLVASTTQMIEALPTSLWLAKRLTAQGHSVALLNLGNGILRGVSFEKMQDVPTLSEGVADAITLLTPSSQNSIDVTLTSDAVLSLLTRPTSRYDRVIICADADQAMLASRAFAEAIAFKIALVRPSKTTRAKLDGLNLGRRIDAVVSFDT